ncbi:P-loop NTPase fold protein [uncultured Maribacter sp.]|uniref:KAP family P-loop NTPase fold protein n=1 Tax=uncultured Maribacter sp. TaxID=431308 RepID=UPI00260852F2|nr:P-loop NTPase fold protein [uncultured Maribacter sp.]
MAIKFIEDKEFDLSHEENEDLLGTKPYAETLFEVVRGSFGKQNIGLFGGWGSGKSTIISTLESFIIDYNKGNKEEKIAYFKYDAWKYSNDDFRRSFIKSLNSDFKILNEDAINNIVYKETTTQDPKKSKTPINGKQIFLLSVSAIVLLLVVGMFVLPQIEDNDTKSILVLVSLLASFLFYLSKDFFRVIPFTVKQSKLIEPERFEETFKLIIGKIFGFDDNWMIKFKKFVLSKLDYKKIVIVIDNLDRCDNENLKETLATMKNFLETENVVFIIPVDENGITSFLNGETEDADEYLRKIFHQIIRLKKFTPKELVDFTNRLNRKYELGLSKIGIRLICQEFTTNPRKIIQFLNNLQTERDLIIRQINESYIKLEFNNQADEFLIKLLIIKQEWNHLYRMLLDDINFLNKINNSLRNEIKQKGIFFLMKLGKNELKLTRDQKRFFKRNRDVHFNNIEPFILNVDRDKDVPDELRVLIENGELNEIFELLLVDNEKGIEKGKAQILLEQIEISYDYNSNKFEDYHSIAPPVLELLIGLLDYDIVRKEINENLRNYSFIKRVFTNNQFSGLIPNIVDYKGFCVTSKWFYEEVGFKVPYNRLFEYLNTSIKSDTTIEGIHSKIREFIEIFKTDVNLISGLQSNLEGKVIEEPKLLPTYPNSSDDFEVIASLFSPKFIDKMLEKLNEDKIEDIKAKKALISLTNLYIEKEYLKDSLIITEFTNYYIKQLSSEYSLKSIKSKGIFELDTIVNKVTFLIPKSDIDTIKIESTLLENILQKFKQEYSQSLSKIEIEKYINFFKMVLEYMFLDGDFSTHENITKYFTFFFSKTEHNELSLAINDSIYQKEVAHFGPNSWSFFSAIIQKLSTNKRFTYVSTLMMMFLKSTSEKGLKAAQQETVSNTILSMFLTYRNTSYASLISKMNSWFDKVNSKNEKLLYDSINKLDIGDLERYVYSIHRFDNATTYIFNSFENHLANQNNYKSFEKFVRFVFSNYTVDVQMEMLQSYCTEIKSYDWLFSCKKYVHKRVFNSLFQDYIDNYKGQSENSAYLKNLLKLNRNELYSTQKTNTMSFLDNLKNPTKSHRNKTKQIKNRL